MKSPDPSDLLEGFHFWISLLIILSYFLGFILSSYTFSKSSQAFPRPLAAVQRSRIRIAAKRLWNFCFGRLNYPYFSLTQRILPWVAPPSVNKLWVLVVASGLGVFSLLYFYAPKSISISFPFVSLFVVCNLGLYYVSFQIWWS